MTEPNAPTEQSSPEAPPPVLGSWRRLYLVLVVELALITLLAWALQRWAAA
ncbi:MAG: hypothetical protein ABW321_21255 [Polyangiales bacterium]